MNSEAKLLPAEIAPDLMPEVLRNSGYYVGNDESVQLEMAVKQEIMALEDGLEPWNAKAAKLFAEGESIRAIARTIKKQQQQISRFIKTLPAQKLVHHRQHLAVLQDGPNEILRKHMLWRIAVDNEKGDPKEATKALAELNKMTQVAKGGGGQTFNIVISNNVLQKGALDG